MFKVCCHSVCISQKSCFHIKTKISTGQLSNLLFLAYLSEHSWQIFPSINSAFSSFKTWTVPPYSFARDVDIDCGTLVSREPQTRRLYN